MAHLPAFSGFNKIVRLSRDIIITEKIDGTNAQVYISDDGKEIRAGSRQRWISVGDDNFGFARWVEQNKEELLTLGPGAHFGEWWGVGIQRGYHLSERRFSLFNASRWKENCPKCCSVVPTLYVGPFETPSIERVMADLITGGSVAAPSFMTPEGIVIFHTAGNLMFKKTCVNDDKRKSEQ